MIKGIKFVNIPVTDQARALASYTEQLGFTVATNQPMGPGGQPGSSSKSRGRDAGLAFYAARSRRSRGHVRPPLALGRRRRRHLRNATRARRRVRAPQERALGHLG